MDIVPSTQQGMGAIPYGGGVAFRVWAKFAGAVFVAGDFNGWSTSANPLAPEGNGYWSIDIPEARTGQQYKYYIPAAPPDGWRVDPYARSISYPALNTIIAPTSIIYNAPNYSTPAWNELVIYELHIQSFLYDPASYNGLGSLQSAASKLSYLANLGVNAIEVMPLGQFLGDFSAGYNPCYIFAVENEWGGPDAFRDFVNRAHQLGIAVILDVVYNHIGPSAGDMWDFDGWSQAGACPFDGSSTSGGIYFYNDYRAHTNYAHTRFDYGRPEVRQYIRDNALVWLQQRFVDGLRFDSVGAIRNVLDRNNDPAYDLPDGWSLLQRINDDIRASQPWKITIAEDLKDNEWITKPTGAGGAGFGAQWGAGFLNVVRNVLIAEDDGQRDLSGVRDMILQRYNDDAFQRVICTETHDAADNKWGDGRVPHQIWPDTPYSWASKKRSTLGAALVLTAPGIPMIFMGQEFLEWTPFDGTTQLDWSKSTTYSGITTLYRDLIRLRRNWFDTTRGLRGQGVEVCPPNGADQVLVFHRWDQGGPGDDVVVICNFANRGYTNYAIGFPRSGRWRVRFNSDWRGYSDDFGNWFAYDTDAGDPPLNGMPCSGNIGIGPYACVILSQDRTA
jgi:1,4-alpha-glucan branching enzyme